MRAGMKPAPTFQILSRAPKCVTISDAMYNHTPSALGHKLPEDLKRCIAFHGHLCPGLVYGYLVAKEAVRLLGLRRSQDEEVVVISENDTCAVDALQVLLGTTTGKGNLMSPLMPPWPLLRHAPDVLR